MSCGVESLDLSLMPDWMNKKTTQNRNTIILMNAQLHDTSHLLGYHRLDT